VVPLRDIGSVGSHSEKVTIDPATGRHSSSHPQGVSQSSPIQPPSDTPDAAHAKGSPAVVIPPLNLSELERAREQRHKVNQKILHAPFVHVGSFLTTGLQHATSADESDVRFSCVALRCAGVAGGDDFVSVRSGSWCGLGVG
jgi:hypothetical protein